MISRLLETLTYIRNSWGKLCHSGNPQDVAKMRTQLGARPNLAAN